VRPVYFIIGETRVHVSLTTLDGCTTECGLPLNKGTSWTTIKPEEEALPMCKGCAAAYAKLSGRLQ
jgi:hypothetical protein